MYNFKNGAEISIHAKEVTGYNAIKVSSTWEGNSEDIARVIKNYDGLSERVLIGKSKVHVEISFNYEDKEGDLNKEFIKGVKEFMKDDSDVMIHVNYYRGTENTETTDGFPIKIEVVWEKKIKDLEGMGPYDIIASYAQSMNIEADGKVVNVNELMSMVNEHHGSSLASDASIYHHSPEVEYMSSI